MPTGPRQGEHPLDLISLIVGWTLECENKVLSRAPGIRLRSALLEDAPLEDEDLDFLQIRVDDPVFPDAVSGADPPLRQVVELVDFRGVDGSHPLNEDPHDLLSTEVTRK
jgi:hypothetical protein